MHSGKLLWRHKAAETNWLTLNFSRDSKTLAIYDLHKMQLREAKSGKLLRDLPEVKSLNFLRDGSIIACDEDEMVGTLDLHLWRINKLSPK